jgi:antitoxin (DNA-binding transcriptional repressor) of toxin-antitoxin stability system
MADFNLSTLIAESLAAGGDAEKNAFLRYLGKAMEIELDLHSVREAKNDFSGLLDRVRRCQAATIAPHRRTKDAVVVISLAQLAKTLAAVASDFEQSPTADAHNPMMMFAAVDRLPEVGEADAAVVQRPRRERSTLNLD